MTSALVPEPSGVSERSGRQTRLLSEFSIARLFFLSSYSFLFSPFTPLSFLARVHYVSHYSPKGTANEYLTLINPITRFIAQPSGTKASSKWKLLSAGLTWRHGSIELNGRGSRTGGRTKYLRDSYRTNDSLAEVKWKL